MLFQNRSGVTAGFLNNAMTSGVVGNPARDAMFTIVST